MNRLGYLFAMITQLLKEPQDEKDEHREERLFTLKRARREVHYIYGTNPIYIPKRKKLKGWQKELKRNK